MSIAGAKSSGTVVTRWVSSPTNPIPEIRPAFASWITRGRHLDEPRGARDGLCQQGIRAA